jgi:hypothetical protein
MEAWKPGDRKPAEKKPPAEAKLADAFIEAAEGEPEVKGSFFDQKTEAEKAAPRGLVTAERAAPAEPVVGDSTARDPAPGVVVGELSERSQITRRQREARKKSKSAGPQAPVVAAFAGEASASERPAFEAKSERALIAELRREVEALKVELAKRDARLEALERRLA